MGPRKNDLVHKRLIVIKSVGNKYRLAQIPPKMSLEIERNPLKQNSNSQVHQQNRHWDVAK